MEGGMCTHRDITAGQIEPEVSQFSALTHTTRIAKVVVQFRGLARILLASFNCFGSGGNPMGHLARLQLVGRITYYVGWIALLCGTLVHLGIGRTIFTAISLTKRNLFEAAVVCFVICIASELRALASPEGATSGVLKKPVAA